MSWENRRDSKKTKMPVCVWKSTGCAKRLAEFYRNEGASHRVRIVIPTGHYTPEFLVQDQDDEVAVAVEPELESVEVVVPVEVPDLAPLPEPVWEPAPLVIEPHRGHSWNTALKGAIAVIVVAAAGLAICSFVHSSDPLERLWRPVLAAPSPTLLCIGDQAGGHAFPEDKSDPTKITVHDFHGMRSQSVLISDAAIHDPASPACCNRGKGLPRCLAVTDDV